MPPPIPPPHPLLGLLVDEAGTLLVARGDDGLYRRAAADSAWQRVLPLQPPIAGAAPVLFDSGRAGWFFVWERRDAEAYESGRSRWTGPARRSTDHGATWQAVPPHHWLAVDNGGRLIGSDDDIRLFASTDGGKSVERGAVFACPRKEPCISRLSIVGATWVITRAFGESTQRSDDGGKTWVESPRSQPAAQLRVGATWLATDYWIVFRRDDPSPDWRPFEGRPEGERIDTLLAAARPDRVLVMRQWRGEDTHMDFPPPILRKEACVTDLRQPCHWTPLSNSDRLLNMGAGYGGLPLTWRGNTLYGFDWYAVRRATVVGDRVLPSQEIDDRGFAP